MPQRQIEPEEWQENSCTCIYRLWGALTASSCRKTALTITKQPPKQILCHVPLYERSTRITSCRAHRCAGARVWAFSGCGARWRVLDLQLLLSRQPILAAVPAVTATIRLMAHGRAGTVQGVSVKGASGVKACSQKSRTGFLNARTDFLNARTGLRKVFNFKWHQCLELPGKMWCKRSVNGGNDRGLHELNVLVDP